MKKIYKSLASIMTLILTILVSCPQAEAGVSYPSNLYLTQHTDVTCTLVSNVMMLRARMYLGGNNNWPNLTEESVAPVAWINGAGQRSSYTYSGYGATMNVNQAYVNGLTLSSLRQILNAHPEGVCIYVTSIPHAQWITDIENDVVYSGDSSGAAFFGRRPLADTWQGYCCGRNQNTVLANVTSYWYISSSNLTVQNTTAQTVRAARSIPDGRYRLACKADPSYGLDVAGKSKDDEANVHLWKYTEDQANQEFDITWNGEFYHIQAHHSGKNLDLYRAGSAKGTNVQQYKVDGTDVQKWTFKDTGDGSYYIINHNGLYMDLSNGTVANGTNIQGWEGNGSNAQKWLPIPVDKKQELPDGDYRIAVAKDISYTLDCQGGGTTQNTNIQIYKAWEPGQDGLPAQIWSVKHIGNGYYQILSKKSGLSLNVQGNAYTGAPNVQLYPYTAGDAASTWILKETGDGSFYVICKNGKFLDINNASIANGTNVQGWTGNGTDAQKWRFVAADGTQTIADGYYNICASGNNAYGLDVSGVSKDNGANVHLWTIGEGYNQKWKVTYLNNGYYSIAACHTGKALDVHNAGKARGANIQQWDNTASTNSAQQWIIRDAGNGTFYVINRNGLFMDISTGKIANGTNIQGWYGNGTAAQKWAFKKTFYDSEGPKITDVKITDVSYAGYRVTCTVTDNVGVTQVQMPSWSNVNGQDDIVWHNATISGNTASYYVKTSDHNDETGEYTTHIYAYDKAGNKTAINAGTINVPSVSSDTEAPKISDAVISEITPEGFRVTCRVSDNVMVKSVKMAVWTDANGQDDIVWHNATLSTSGDMATAYIKASEHRNEYGAYTVHVYAWDKADNRTGIPVGKVEMPLTSGVYRVASFTKQAFGVDVEGKGTSNGANIHLWTYSGGENQKFEFKYNGKGYYTIYDCNSGKVLDVKDGSEASGTNVQLWEDNGTDAQLWRVTKNTDGSYKIVNKLGHTLDVNGANYSNGTNIQVWTNNNTDAQKWTFIAVEKNPSTASGNGNGYQTYQGGRGGTGNIVSQGIDVSEHQGAGFNFAAMKAAGCNYVILRCGWVGRKDYRFDEYYNAARAAGLDIGAYFYSYAENTAEALNEANVCLQQIAGKKFEYPIYFDFEDNTYQGHLNSAQSRDVCLAFMDRVASQGYLVGLYGMASWIDEDWGGKVPTATVCKKYECWIANYASNVSGYTNVYKTRYGMYQYSDGGTTAPTRGFGVDSSYCFKDYPAIVKQHHFNGY